MKKAVILLAAFSAFASAQDQAVEKDVSGFYLGGGFGTTTYDDDAAFSTLETKYSTVKLIGGYQFNRIVGVETQFTKYSNITAPGLSGYAIETAGISIAANLGYTFDSGWRPFGTIGLTQLSFDVDDYGSKDETALRLGAGVEYTPASLENLNFRVAYEVDTFSVDTGHWLYNDVTVQLGSFYAGATYKF
ncbi:porin family protein [Vibrio sp. Sgm 22]|uniref:outer membrane protein n=1 Tax=unclassified Vibrio TaxID=2614977 RepID=UPI0022498EBB|nr:MULTISPECIES: porin family protein [unclassified Vibrio]MCX2758197.1 porin family protein [Vibrio sp. 14G-20]MCX2775443.1 porin family protein [Vibrio sp. Sgm 22]